MAQDFLLDENQMLTNYVTLENFVQGVELWPWHSPLKNYKKSINKFTQFTPTFVKTVYKFENF